MQAVQCYESAKVRKYPDPKSSFDSGLIGKVMGIYNYSELDLAEMYCRMRIVEAATLERNRLRSGNTVSGRCGDRHILHPRLLELEKHMNGSIESLFEQEYMKDKGLTFDGFIDFLYHLDTQHTLYKENNINNLLD
jgi:hypothetical protein